jgi:type IV pilus biogenesis protein CpaD/CtpE
MSRSIVFIVWALLLAGCANEAADRGHLVATNLVTLRREVPAPLGAYSNPLKARRLRQQAISMAEGDMQAVHAEIVGASPGEADVVHRALIGAGIDPTRITEATWLPWLRRRPAIIFTRTVAASADCSGSVDFAFPDDPSPSLMSLAHCTQDHNLAAMVVDPSDLVAPPNLDPADGAYLANGVRTWRAHRNDPGATVSPDVSSPLNTALPPNSGVTPGTGNR